MPFDSDAFSLQVRGIPRSLGSLAFRISEDKDDTFVWSLAVCKVLWGILVRMFMTGREFQIYQY